MILCLYLLRAGGPSQGDLRSWPGACHLQQGTYVARCALVTYNGDVWGWRGSCHLQPHLPLPCDALRAQTVSCHRSRPHPSLALLMGPHEVSRTWKAKGTLVFLQGETPCSSFCSEGEPPVPLSPWYSMGSGLGRGKSAAPGATWLEDVPHCLFIIVLRIIIYYCNG